MPTLTDYYKKLSTYFGPQHWWPADSKIEVMVGAVLAQNTAWRNVEKAIANLKTFRLLDARKLHELDVDTLAMAVKPAGTYNQKALRLKALIAWFVERYDADFDRVRAADPERIRQELLDIRGIGRETADAILLYVFEFPMFVIDTYTYRMLHRHGLVGEETTYEEMQELFHRQLPRDTKLFNEYHALIVELGKKFCKARAQCDHCPLKVYLPQYR